MSVPLIIVGDEIITGFDKDKIEKLINNWKPCWKIQYGFWFLS
jgi:hypothetical protein